MQFEFKEEDILRLANEIDNRAEYPEVYPDPIVVKFSGDFASFSRPEFRVEKMTYKVPTFSALRNRNCASMELLVDPVLPLLHRG